MKLWFVTNWENLRASYWFVPTLMVAGAIVLSLATIHLDKIASSTNWLATLGWTFTRGPEGSRAVLSTVAASMMTIASVTFSITVVALQLASSQFGPRLLRNFMQDRGNQFSIGTFISTFTYCLLVLRTVNGTEGEQFVPHISVTVGLILGVTSVGVFIYFIHHSAESIQVENVIVGVSRDLHAAIDRLYPECLGREPKEVSTDAKARDLPTAFDIESCSILAPESNYLQAIDVDRLTALAMQHELVVSIKHRPGRFFFKGGDLARAWPGDRVTEAISQEIRGTFYFGTRRTLTQDVEFAIDQLVEVAVRALSPGINDPFTAVNCVDLLGSAICALSDKAIPSPYRYDEKGCLRVVTDTSTVSGIIDAAFNQIRQAAHGDASVTLRMLESIAAISNHTQDPAFRHALRRQADAIHRGSKDGLKDPLDHDEADQRYQEVIQSFNEKSSDSRLAEALD